MTRADAPTDPHPSLARFLEKMARNQWEPRVHPVNGHWHVEPLKGVISMDNWPMGLRFWERLRGGGNYRLMYPNTEARLRRSVSLCALFCERTNAAEARAKEVAQRVAGDMGVEHTS